MKRWSVVFCLVGAALIIGGCGGGSNDQTAEELRIDREVASAKQDANQAAQIRELKRKLKKKNSGGGTTVVAVPSGGSSSSGSNDSGSSDTQSFHTDNVSCELSSSGATCTVISTGEDFVLDAGSPAYSSFGGSLPSGYGASSSWGTTWSAGGVTCVVPESYEPSGIICTDDSGHGFEASKVADRKATY